MEPCKPVGTPGQGISDLMHRIRSVYIKDAISSFHLIVIFHRSMSTQEQQADRHVVDFLLEHELFVLILHSMACSSASNAEQ